MEIVCATDTNVFTKKNVCRFTSGTMTFAEAYRKTGRIFCVTLSSTTRKAPPVLLNYMTAPNVTIASAVVASAAVPGFIPPVRLQYSKLAVFRF
jgi:predicted acylesterase/phospholipase RssA